MRCVNVSLLRWTLLQQWLRKRAQDRAWGAPTGWKSLHLHHHDMRIVFKWITGESVILGEGRSCAAACVSAEESVEKWTFWKSLAFSDCLFVRKTHLLIQAVSSSAVFCSVKWNPGLWSNSRRVCSGLCPPNRKVTVLLLLPELSLLDEIWVK